MSDFRPASRLVKLVPSAIRSKVGIVPLAGAAGTANRWWTNGSIAWRDDVLDKQSLAFIETHAKIVRNEMSIDAFWPANATLKLRYETSVHNPQNGQRYSVYQNGEVLRFVSEKTRAPQFLYTSHAAVREPVLLPEEGSTAEVRLGKLRPQTSARNMALVDAPSAAEGKMLIYTDAMPIEMVETAQLQLKLITLDQVTSLSVADEYAAMQQSAKDALFYRPAVAAPTGTREIKVPSYRMAALEKSIATITRSAKRLGIKPPTLKKTGDIDLPVYDSEGKERFGVREPGFLIEIDVPELVKLPGDFTLLAKIEQLEPGVNLIQPLTEDTVAFPPELRSCGMNCEHCGKIRSRNFVYYLENNATGDRKVIGSSCLADFTGHPGLEALASAASAFRDQLDEMTEIDEESEPQMSASRLKYHTAEFLSVVACFVRKNGKYVTKKMADRDNLSTAELALDAFNDPSGGLIFKEVTQADRDNAAAAIAWAGTELTPVSEFDLNLQTFARLSSFAGKFAGTVGYLIPAFMKARAPVVQKQVLETPVAAPPQKTQDEVYPVGVSVGDRITVDAMVTFHTSFEVPRFNGRGIDLKHLYKFVDADGRVYVWANVNSPDVTEGVPQAFEEKRQATIARFAASAANKDFVSIKPATEAEIREYLIQESKGQPRIQVAWDGSLPEPATWMDTAEFVQWLSSPTPTDQLPPVLQKRIASVQDNSYARLNRSAEWMREELLKPQQMMHPYVLEMIEYDAEEASKERLRGLQENTWYRIVGSVKEFGEYKGTPQTTLIRCKFTRFGLNPPPPPVAAAPKAKRGKKGGGGAPPASAPPASTPPSSTPPATPAPAMAPKMAPPPIDFGSVGASVHSLLEKLHALKATADVLLPLEQAFKVLSAEADDTTVVLIPLPSNLAKRFPDQKTWNHGHQPHATLCFVGKDLNAGDVATTLSIVRAVCKRMPAFRLRLDVGAGLQSFGPNDKGEQALWAGVSSDPKDVLFRLHRAVRMALEDEGIKVGHQDQFVPHVTWAYVPDEDAKTSSDAFARWNVSFASSMADVPLVWNVDHVMFSAPGRELKVMLNGTVGAAKRAG